MELQDQQADGNAYQEQNFFIPFGKPVVLIEELEVVEKGAAQCEQRVSRQALVDGVDPVKLEVPNAVLVPDSCEVWVQHHVDDQKYAEVCVSDTEKDEKLKTEQDCSDGVGAVVEKHSDRS